MCLRNSVAGPQWTSPRYFRRLPSNNSNNQLVIEDLDLPEFGLSPSTGGTSSANESSPAGCVFYKEDDDGQLFGEPIPAVVSETYLMDDLYVLVKVPTSSKKQVPTSSISSQTTPKSLRSTPAVESNLIIYPIQEEEEELSLEEYRSQIPVISRRKKLCWANDTNAQEEFVSTTNIIHDLGALPNQVPDLPQEEVSENNHSHRQESASPTCQKEIEVQEINLNSARFKGLPNVCLENYGILITPTKTPRTENLLVFQVDTEPKENTKENGSACFDWLANIFRRKRRSSGFVHAKVYKTYFVKWKKCSTEAKCQCRKNPRRNSAEF